MLLGIGCFILGILFGMISIVVVALMEAENDEKEDK